MADSCQHGALAPERTSNNGFGVCLETVEDRLPTISLHLDRVLGFGLENSFHYRGAFNVSKCGLYLPTFAQDERDHLLGLDFLIDALEIKTETPVLGFNARPVSSADDQVNFSTWTMPVFRSKIPARDMLRRCVSMQNRFDRRRSRALSWQVFPTYLPIFDVRKVIGKNTYFRLRGKLLPICVADLACRLVTAR